MLVRTLVSQVLKCYWMHLLWCNTCVAQSLKRLFVIPTWRRNQKLFFPPEWWAHVPVERVSKDLALVSAQVSSTVTYVLVQTAPRVSFQFECTMCMNYCVKHPPSCRVWTLHRWPCYHVCFSKTPFSVWSLMTNDTTMTAGRRWEKILGCFVRQLWRQSKPNRSFWATDLPVRNKLTSTHHHGIDFTSQHWQGSQPKSHTLSAQFIRLKSSPQREHSHRCLFFFFLSLN